MAKKLTIKTVSGTTTVIVPSKEDIQEQIDTKVDPIIDDVEDIKDGTTVVKKAEQDENGNNIKDTYATVTYVDGKISGVFRPSGNWNANTNTPTLANNEPTNAGKVYYVTDAGTQFGLTFAVGDKLAFIEGGVATKWDNVDDVTSVNGKVGTVVIHADDIPFDGSGTNYLVGETEVEGAIKELDTRVKTNADNIALKVNTSDIVNNLTSTDTNKPLSANQGKVLNDTTAKLNQSNVFTQPQQVPNATLPQHATNLIQVETMFEMFKQQLRGYNLSKPDLSTATDLGGGNYRLYNGDGITVDYNVSSGIWTFNGTSTLTLGNVLFNIEQNTQYTLSYIAVSGTLSGGQLLLGVSSPYTVVLNQNNQNADKQNTFVTTTQDRFRFDIPSGTTFTNYQFKLQLEKGSTATPYTVPGQIPQYKIVGEE